MIRKVMGLAALAVCLLSICWPGSMAVAATTLQIVFTNSGTPVAGGEVVLFFSNEAISTVTDQAGLARFSIESGKGFWIEVNGQRLAKFYSMTQPPANIDIATVGTMQWRGRR